MDVVDPTLGSSHMQAAAVEVNLVPSQPAHFRGAQPVTVRDQDHGGVAVPVAGPLAGGFLKALDLLLDPFPFAEICTGNASTDRSSIGARMDRDHAVSLERVRAG
jgi:hypothetical protein